MIAGEMNADLEAVIQIVVRAASGQKQIEAVIDTGFSGDLTLPADVVAFLNLTWLGREEGVRADGSVDLFEVYRATVIWGGAARFVEVQAVNAQPLAGMTLLRGHSLRIDVVTGGAVTVHPLA
jgi:clan AA aspartic protease